MEFRLRVRADSHVSDAMLCKWVLGDQSVDEYRCRTMVDVCARFGVVPPLGAKLAPLPVGVSAPAPSSLRAVS
jgi:hypothetical protein